MKRALLAIAIAALAGSATAAQLVEAIVIRVGDRVVTRTQYLKRLHDGYNEIEQTAQSSEDAAKKEEFRKNLTNGLISELLSKDRADRLNLTVGHDEIQVAIEKLKQQ